MVKEGMKVGEISKPRFEFRTFGSGFDGAEERMARLSVPIPEKLWKRESDEIYIMSRTNDNNNTKIRGGKLDIKTYVQTKDGLEQWNPLTKTVFPVSADFLRSDIFPAFQVDLSELEQDKYTMDEFLEMVKAHPDLQAVSVFKKRYGYMVNDTICEVALVLINGAEVITINSESTVISDVLKTLEDCHLNEYENINYLQAIKRVLGWIDKPLAS